MRAFVRRLYNSGLDRYFGVRTEELPAPTAGHATAHRDAQIYIPTDYLALLYLFAPLQLGEGDVFVDLGCGLGRALVLAARRPIRKAIGVEFTPSYADAARVNASRARRLRAPVEVVTADAAVADLREGTAFWMYHPFGAATMERVMDRLGESIAAHPRRVRIGYVNPVHASVLDGRDWLQRSGERRFPGAHESGHALYWEARPGEVRR